MGNPKHQPQPNGESEFIKKDVMFQQKKAALPPMCCTPPNAKFVENERSLPQRRKNQNRHIISSTFYRTSAISTSSMDTDDNSMQDFIPLKTKGGASQHISPSSCPNIMLGTDDSSAQRTKLPRRSINFSRLRAKSMESKLSDEDEEEFVLVSPEKRRMELLEKMQQADSETSESASF